MIKVFDHQETKNLSWLKNDLFIRTNFVGNEHSNILKCYGASRVNEESLFEDNNGFIHHYPSGYSMVVYDYCESGDLLSFVLSKEKWDLNQVELIRTVFS